MWVFEKYCEYVCLFVFSFFNEYLDCLIILYGLFDVD